MSIQAFVRRPAVLLVLGLCLVGVVVSVVGRLATGPQREPQRTPFTSDAGAHDWAAFSPDGKQAAYSAHAASEAEVYHLFVRALAGGAPRQLTSGQGSDIGPAWSPDGGRLAFLRVEGGAWRIMTIPAAGGEPRSLAEFAAPEEHAQPQPSAAWTPDGKSLVVAGARKGQPSALWLVAVDSAAVQPLTSPAAGTPGDYSPAVSPDGATVAFVRGADPENREARTVSLRALPQGAVRNLTFEDHAIRGLAWMPGGAELVYASDRGSHWRLWRLAVAGGTPRDLLIGGGQAQFPAISKDGRLLFTERSDSSSIWRAELSPAGSAPAATAPAGTAPAGTASADARERPLIGSGAWETDPAISPDGTRIANVERLDSEERIMVADAGGGGRYALAAPPGALRLRRLRWSPDGGQLLFECWSQRGQETYRIEAKPGVQPVRVIAQGGGASWSADGKSVYYEWQGRVWVCTAWGREAREIAVTRRGSSPEVSEDGKYVYFRSRRSIWRVPSGGGQAEEVIVPERDLAQSVTQPVRDGVYYLEWAPVERGAVLYFYDFATRKSTARLTLKDVEMSGNAFRVSPDGKYVLYSKTGRNETNLVLVDNFR